MATNNRNTPFFDISDDCKPIESGINKVIAQKNEVQREIHQNQQDISDLADDLAILSKEFGIDLPKLGSMEAIVFDDAELNLQYDKILREIDKEIHKSVPRLPKLSKQDFIVAACIGLLATLIDFFLVGIPHKGRSPITGSPLTDILRKIGQSKDGKGLSPFFKWFEDKCKVPYDLSAMKDVMYPGNHRLRSFAHDPFFGLFFAVFDCIYGTCTCIDNNGKIRIITGRSKPTIFPIILYFGHLVSDVCTSSGLPVPGWVFTQFFTNGDNKNTSIARVAESMYRNGYDLRHFVSMSSSVGMSKVLVCLYLIFEQGDMDKFNKPLYEREIEHLNHEMIKEKMLLIANVVATSGNLVKIIAPPSNGNPAALNLPQWFMLLKSAIKTTRVAFRDRTPELIVENRKNINDAWNRLLVEP